MAFSDNIWWTRKARIQTEKRLLSNAFQSQLVLLWYSFAGVSASIYYLKFANDSDLAGVTWVIYSVLSLTVSGFIAGLSFKARAALIKECYETLKVLNHKVDLLEKQDKENSSGMTEYQQEYNDVLGLCENHTDMDHIRALCIEHLNTHGKPDPKTGFKGKLTDAPSRYQWLQFWSAFAMKWIGLAFVWFLPVFIFLGMELLNECTTEI